MYIQSNLSIKTTQGRKPKRSLQTGGIYRQVDNFRNLNRDVFLSVWTIIYQLNELNHYLNEFA